MAIFPNNSRPNPAELRRFISRTSPQDAKARVEAMLSEGRMTMEQFDELGKQATELMRKFGIR